MESDMLIHGAPTFASETKSLDRKQEFEVALARYMVGYRKAQRDRYAPSPAPTQSPLATFFFRWLRARGLSA